MIGLSLLFMVTLGASQQIAGQQSASQARNATRDKYMVSATDVAGIREVIPEKYQKRYDEWKSEFLSTDIGKAQWEMYAHHPKLILTITIANANKEGAGSGKYKWNDAGELDAATIRLGNQIDQGIN